MPDPLPLLFLTFSLTITLTLTVTNTLPLTPTLPLTLPLAFLSQLSLRLSFVERPLTL